MVDMCLSLGIDSYIQQEAIQLLSNTRRGFMRSDLFRERLIKSLAKRDYSAIFLPRINSEVEALVEQQLLLRQIKNGEHEIGLNKVVWKIPSETISLIHEATIIVSSGRLFESDFCDVVHDVKMQLRKMGGARRQVSDTAFDILVARFNAHSSRLFR